jgi:nucleoside-diphosphate-sugar epimerase
VNVLVTGGAGYLGSVLLPKLVVRGHKVRVLDVGYFGISHLRAMQPAPEVVREDLRRVRDDRRFRDELLAGCHRVIHLAAVSNDPSAELNPELTEEVNFQATAALAEGARAAGARFLFSSSCSVYGEAPGLLDEDGPVNPLTAYARSKVEAERALEALAGPGWRPVVLRNGTLFGYSPRMRFDLVVNIFSLYSTLRNEVKVFGDGLQWRPFLHVADCARAFVHFAELPEPGHARYNIAHENLRVADLVEVFRAINPRLRPTFVDVGDPDRRDYRVDSRRMTEAGFRTRHSVAAGAEHLVESIVNGLIPDPESIFYRNAKWLKELTQIGARGHKDIVQLMETMSAVRNGSRP